MLSLTSWRAAVYWGAGWNISTMCYLYYIYYIYIYAKYVYVSIYIIYILYIYAKYVYVRIFMCMFVPAYMCVCACVHAHPY